MRRRGMWHVSEAEQLQRRTPGRRLLELDALRGLGSVVVAVAHAHTMFQLHEAWYWRPFLNATSALMLFFVLSGYVLSLAYWQGRQSPYSDYLIRRFFRIYVPYACACILALLVGRHFLYANLPLTPWFYLTWHIPFTTRLVTWQLLGMSISPAINTAFWSLRYEVEMSIVLPLIYPVIRWLRPRGTVTAVVVMMLFASILARVRVLLPIGVFHIMCAESTRTLLYGTAFILGALAAWKIDAVHAYLRSMPAWMRHAALAGALLGYAFGPVQVSIPSTAALIVFATGTAGRRLLINPVFDYLGRISYSLYLIHGTVLFAVVIALYGKVPMGAVIAVYLVLAFICAHIFNRVLEEPADRAGKGLAGALKAARSRATLDAANRSPELPEAGVGS